MKWPDPLHQVRSKIASLFDTSDEQAKRGMWWEIDLLFVILLGAFGLGLAAWVELFL